MATSQGFAALSGRGAIPGAGSNRSTALASHGLPGAAMSRATAPVSVTAAAGLPEQGGIGMSSRQRSRPGLAWPVPPVKPCARAPAGAFFPQP